MSFVKNILNGRCLFLALLFCGMLCPLPSYAADETAAETVSFPDNETGTLAQEPGDLSPEDTVDTLTQEKVIVYKGDLRELKVYDLTRIAIVEPGIIEIVSADVDKILVVGNSEGETSVFIWDSHGKRRIEIQVVSKDLDYVMARMQKLFDAVEVTGIKLEKNELEGKVQITGKYDKEKKDAFDKVVEKFGDQVLNLALENKKLIEIDVQITELSTTLTKEMGVLWGQTAFTWTETVPGGAHSLSNLGDWFKIGDFTRTGTITAAVNALISENRGRILSKPNVVVTNGEAATFLVGGEIPIKTTTSNQGIQNETVSYKSYGIDLTVTPEIQQNNKIDVMLSVAIRDIDGTVQTGNTTAFTTRSADTKLLLDDGQTIVLAGLIKQNRGTQEKGIPFLRKIPVLGLLFNNIKWTPRTDIEVVISLTPHILPDMSEGREDAKKTALAEVAAQVEKDSKEYMKKAEGEEGDETEEDEGQGEEALSGLQGSAIVPEGLGGREIAPSVEDVSSYLTNYVQGVQKKIANAISFPYEAKEKKWEGTVTLKLKLLSNGELNKVEVKDSSGHDIFDKDALNTAKIVAPFGPFPAEVDLEELDVTVPVTYSQAAVLEGAAPEQQ